MSCHKTYAADSPDNDAYKTWTLTGVNSWLELVTQIARFILIQRHFVVKNADQNVVSLVSFMVC